MSPTCLLGFCRKAAVLRSCDTVWMCSLHSLSDTWKQDNLEKTFRNGQAIQAAVAVGNIWMWRREARAAI